MDAARSSQLQVELMTELRNRRVSDTMEHDCSTVEGNITLKEFVDEYLLRTGKRCFIVMKNNRTRGLVTPA
ncbi:MAG: hypothetical protein DMG76_00585 [Acidobacteria bacterium]|nr:MAG: hypothetical protein DMG76_00585 [Acidobacteriota bacterium]